jgi:hypothetical protein
MGHNGGHETVFRHTNNHMYPKVCLFKTLCVRRATASHAGDSLGGEYDSPDGHTPDLLPRHKLYAPENQIGILVTLLVLDPALKIRDLIAAQVHINACHPLPSRASWIIEDAQFPTALDALANNQPGEDEEEGDDNADDNNDDGEASSSHSRGRHHNKRGPKKKKQPDIESEGRKAQDAAARTANPDAMLYRNYDTMERALSLLIDTQYGPRVNSATEILAYRTRQQIEDMLDLCEKNDPHADFSIYPQVMLSLRHTVEHIASLCGPDNPECTSPQLAYRNHVVSDGGAAARMRDVFGDDESSGNGGACDPSSDTSFFRAPIPELTWMVDLGNLDPIGMMNDPFPWATDILITTGSVVSSYVSNSLHNAMWGIASKRVTRHDVVRMLCRIFPALDRAGIEAAARSIDLDADANEDEAATVSASNGIFSDEYYTSLEFPGRISHGAHLNSSSSSGPASVAISAMKAQQRNTGTSTRSLAAAETARGRDNLLPESCAIWEAAGLRPDDTHQQSLTEIVGVGIIVNLAFGYVTHFEQKALETMRAYYAAHGGGDEDAEEVVWTMPPAPRNIVVGENKKEAKERAEREVEQLREEQMRKSGRRKTTSTEAEVQKFFGKMRQELREEALNELSVMMGRDSRVQTMVKVANHTANSGASLRLPFRVADPETGLLSNMLQQMMLMYVEAQIATNQLALLRLTICRTSPMLAKVLKQLALNGIFKGEYGAGKTLLEEILQMQSVTGQVEIIAGTSPKGMNFILGDAKECDCVVIVLDEAPMFLITNKLDNKDRDSASLLSSFLTHVGSSNVYRTNEKDSRTDQIRAVQKELNATPGIICNTNKLPGDTAIIQRMEELGLVTTPESGIFGPSAYMVLNKENETTFCLVNALLRRLATLEVLTGHAMIEGGLPPPDDTLFNATMAAALEWLHQAYPRIYRNKRGILRARMLASVLAQWKALGCLYSCAYGDFYADDPNRHFELKSLQDLIPYNKIGYEETFIAFAKIILEACDENRYKIIRFLGEIVGRFSLIRSIKRRRRNILNTLHASPTGDPVAHGGEAPHTDPLDAILVDDNGNEEEHRRNNEVHWQRQTDGFEEYDPENPPAFINRKLQPNEVQALETWLETHGDEVPEEQWLKRFKDYVFCAKTVFPDPVLHVWKGPSTSSTKAGRPSKRQRPKRVVNGVDEEPGSVDDTEMAEGETSEYPLAHSRGETLAVAKKQRDQLAEKIYAGEKVADSDIHKFKPEIIYDPTNETLKTVAANPSYIWIEGNERMWARMFIDQNPGTTLSDMLVQQIIERLSNHNETVRTPMLPLVLDDTSASKIMPSERLRLVQFYRSELEADERCTRCYAPTYIRAPNGGYLNVRELTRSPKSVMREGLDYLCCRATPHRKVSVLSTHKNATQALVQYEMHPVDRPLNATNVSTPTHAGIDMFVDEIQSIIKRRRYVGVRTVWDKIPGVVDSELEAIQALFDREGLTNLDAANYTDDAIHRRMTEASQRRAPSNGPCTVSDLVDEVRARDEEAQRIRAHNIFEFEIKRQREFMKFASQMGLPAAAHHQDTTTAVDIEPDDQPAAKVSRNIRQVDPAEAVAYKQSVTNMLRADVDSSSSQQTTSTLIPVPPLPTSCNQPGPSLLHR